MPTILLVNGWRFFLHANEGREPMHVHARKGDMECKFWLKPSAFDIEEAFAHGLGPADRREVRKIIFAFFFQFKSAWKSFQKRKKS